MTDMNALDVVYGIKDALYRYADEKAALRILREYVESLEERKRNERFIKERHAGNR